jgi:predicted DNA-binding protein with PD1-like motif
MHTVLKEKNIRVIRFDQGDELISGLREYCAQAAIHSGSFSCIGAASSLVLSFYDISKKIYKDKNYEGIWEIANCTGNVSTLSGRVFIHAHGIFSDEHLSCVGGHVKSCIVSATCELTLHVFEKRLGREGDSETGLNLLR